MALLSTVRNIDRLRQITQVLVKHGFGELLARTELSSLMPGGRPGEEAPPRLSFAERTRTAFQELGPTFIKLGQILSTRADLLPVELVSELKKLQEDVPPIPFEDVRAVLEQTLAAPIGDLFVQFDERPLASASIGQVHRARLRGGGLADVAAGAVVDEAAARTDTGIDVAVKVQRPGMRAIIERDLDLLHLLARLVERTFPETKLYAPTRLVAEFERSITAELDYTLEAQSGIEFAKNFRDTPRVHFPRVYADVSGRQVLVLEFLDGLKLADAIAAGYPGDRIARDAVQIIGQMIFIDGLFHADPHPGNIRILGSVDAPVVGLLDFGMVGRLSPDVRDKAMDLMLAAVRRDVDDLAAALLALGRPRSKVDMHAFRAEVDRLSGVHLGKPLREIQLSAMIRDLVQGAVKFDIEMPVEMMMVGKSLMTVEGIGKSIYPDLDIFEEVRPLLMRLLWQRYSPERVGARMLKAGTRLSAAAVDLPPLAAEVLGDLRRGQLRVQTHNGGLERAIDRFGRRVTLALLGVTGVACGTALVASGHAGGAWVLWALGALSAGLALWLPQPRG